MRRRLFKFKELTLVFAISGVFVLGGTLWSYFVLRGISESLILHYGLGQITQVGGVNALLAVGIFGLIVVGINYVLAIALDERDRFIGKLLAAATFLMSLLLFIGFAAIISVN